MRWTSFLLALLTSVLLAGCGLLGKAKNLGTAKGKPNFELVIRAQPEAAQDLLQAHLELNRYRHLEGLRRQELTRLVSVADADIRKLLGTLGYFAPTVELVLEAPPRDSEVLPTVRITVDAGVQTTVAQADIQVTSPQEGEKAGSWQRQSIGRNWPLEVGQPFSQAAWASAKAEGLRSLQARRYPTAALTTSRAEIDADTHQAHLQAHYATGPLVRFGALTIEGGERYDNAGVARAARLPRGGGIPANHLARCAAAHGGHGLVRLGLFNAADRRTSPPMPPKCRCPCWPRCAKRPCANGCTARA